MDSVLICFSHGDCNEKRLGEGRKYVEDLVVLLTKVQHLTVIHLCGKLYNLQRESQIKSDAELAVGIHPCVTTKLSSVPTMHAIFEVLA